MAPEAWSSEALAVTVLCQSFSEKVVCKFSCLLEPIYPFGDLKVYPSVDHVFSYTVFVNEFLRYVDSADADIFGAVKWCSKVKVGYVITGHFGSWCREDIVYL